MPRDHARIRFDMWWDEDFTALPSTSQWLYQRVLQHSDLSYCGVTDWRPARLAQSAVDLTATDVEMFAAVLEDRDFLLIDRETEEVLVRSFVKHDGGEGGLMDRWNMSAAVVRTFGAVASKPLRGVIVGQLHRLRDEHPSLRGWTRDDVQKLLRRPVLTPQDARRLMLPNPTTHPTERVSA